MNLNFNNQQNTNHNSKLRHIMKNSTKLWTKLSALMLVFALVVGCSQKAENTKTADLVYVNWAEGIAYTNLAQAVLEDKMGYEVTITSAGVGPAYTAVANGDKDAFMETWLPVLHEDYYEQFKTDIVDLGKVFEGTQSGLVVPQYVTIDKISEMNEHADKFNGEITGIDAGAGVMKTTKKVIESYNLDFDLISSSGPAMTSALQKAYNNEEWIVVTGWKPHWMFGTFDLKFLEQDEDKMMWKAGDIHIMGRKNLKSEKPELAQFLSNMKLTDAELADLMVKIKNNSDMDKQEIVREWMKNNESVIESWIPSSSS